MDSLRIAFQKAAVANPSNAGIVNQAEALRKVRLAEEEQRRKEAEAARVEAERIRFEAEKEQRNAELLEEMKRTFMEASCGTIRPFLVYNRTIRYGVEEGVVFATSSDAAVRQFMSYFNRRFNGDEYDNYAVEELLTCKNGVLHVSHYFE